MSNIPADLRYSKDHEWIRTEPDGTAYVGITDFAQSQLGDIVFVDIVTQGDTLETDDTFGTIEAVKTVSDAFMPVSGQVLEVNPKLDNAPQTVNKDPYGDGWMIKIKMTDAGQLADLLDAAGYKALIGE